MEGSAAADSFRPRCSRLSKKSRNNSSTLPPSTPMTFVRYLNRRMLGAAILFCIGASVLNKRWPSITLASGEQTPICVHDEPGYYHGHVGPSWQVLNVLHFDSQTSVLHIRHIEHWEQKVDDRRVDEASDYHAAARPGASTRAAAQDTVNQMLRQSSRANVCCRCFVMRV